MHAPPTAPIVLKAGGREIRPGPELEAFAGLVAALVAERRPVIIVHGGGEEVTDRAEALGLETEKRAGQRVTSAPMLEVVLEVLGGRINARILAALLRVGVGAVGLSGASGGLLTVRPMGSPPGRLGFVGIPRRVRRAPLEALLREGLTPVVAPIGIDRLGQLYNVNADVAAGAIAGALGAELWLVTDVPGVRGPDGSTLGTLSEPAVARLLAAGTATDGMIPKLEGARSALGGGARSAWIGPMEALGPQGPAPGAGTRLLPARSASLVASAPAGARRG
jgi:acetylglutamate kinase